MTPTYLISEFDVDSALHHLARLEGEQDWRRETLKDVIATKVDKAVGFNFFHIAGGVYGLIERMEGYQDQRWQVQLLIRPIESLLDDPNKMTVLSVGL